MAQGNRINHPANDLSAVLRRLKFADNGCWLWQGRCDRDGYGLVRVKGKHWRVHRYLYEQFVGPIPKRIARKKAVLDHIVCDTPRCGNPSHVKPSTHRDNVTRSGRSPSAQNIRKTHCPKGHPYSHVYRGIRQCRICLRERNKAKYQRYRQKYVEAAREYRKSRKGKR